MNTNEINRTLGIFTQEEQALRELITHYEERAKFYEAQLLKIARLTEAEHYGDKASRLLSMADQVVDSNAKIAELKIQLRELDPLLKHLDTVS